MHALHVVHVCIFTDHFYNVDVLVQGFLVTALEDIRTLFLWTLTTEQPVLVQELPMKAMLGCCIMFVLLCGIVINRFIVSY